MNDKNDADVTFDENKADYQAQQQKKNRHNPSLFGPIVLITVGIVFLLSNLGQLPTTLNWGAALRLWPLLLVFLGLNLIVRQAPRPFGSLLSALVAIAAILTFAYVVLFADQISVLQGDTAPSQAAVWQRNVPISYPLDGIESADVRIDLNEIPAHIAGLESDANLIEGTVTYVGDLIFDVNRNGNSADVVLDTSTTDWWFFDPGNWNRSAEDDSWDVLLNPNVIYDLYLDTASGSYDIDLGSFTVTDLELDSGSGVGSLVMPSGSYSAQIDSGSGALYAVLPRSGQQQLDIDSGSGNLRFLLPDNMEARMELDLGSGAFSAGDRLRQIGGDDNESIWETSGYADATDKILILIDGGSGSIAVETAEQGR
ncbi:MAG: DUF5668 domain-containing protein [Anaerolineae bacterium]|nr:DUF5668 domain-containing protein [Anaerolineae bacterium]